MTAPRYRKGTWNGMPNWECTQCGYANLDRGKVVAHVRAKHPTAAEQGGEPHPLAEVPFASDEAMELALREGLTAEEMADHHPTGRTGYVLGDVRAVVAARSGSSPEEPTEEDDSGPAEDSVSPDTDTPEEEMTDE